MDSRSVAQHHTGHNGRDQTNPNTPPTRCPPCQTDRTRWVGTVPLGPFRSGHRVGYSPPETALTKCCTGLSPHPRPLGPMEKGRLPVHPEPPTPIPPLSEAACRTTPHRQQRLRGTHGPRVVLHSTKSTLRAERMTPIRPVHPTPPLGSILQSNRMFGRRKHQRARREIGIRRPGRPRRKLRLQLCPIQRSFRHRDIARRLHKSSELAVVHLMGIHQKRRQRHRMGRNSLGNAKLSSLPPSRRSRREWPPCRSPKQGHGAQHPWIPPWPLHTQTGPQPVPTRSPSILLGTPASVE